MMRIEIHVKTIEEVAAVEAQYADSEHEIVIIVAQPSTRSAERQDRKQAVAP